MFSDDTNFFYSHHQIKTVNSELENSQWFRANKLSLNIKKTKYTLFHRYSIKDKIANTENRKQINRKNTSHKIFRSDVG